MSHTLLRWYDRMITKLKETVVYWQNTRGQCYILGDLIYPMRRVEEEREHSRLSWKYGWHDGKVSQHSDWV